MKKPSFRPLLTATAAAAACLLPAMGAHAQTTLQSPGGQPGESAAQPAGQSMAIPMGQGMSVPMSPAQSISQPFPPTTALPLEGDREGLRFRASAGVERDSNVSRVNTGEISDTITSVGVGLRFNKRYSLQRVVLDVAADHYRFDKLDTNYTTLNYSAAWYWAVGNVLDGVASAERRQFRDVTANGLVSALNRRTESNELVEGRYKIGASYRLLAGIQHTASRSTDPTAWDGNPDVTSGRVGVQYESARGSTVTARYRHGDGDYNNALAPKFKDDEVTLAVHWAVSPITAVDATIGNLRREHEGASARNFDGAIGSLGVTWDATAKTRLVAGYSRDLGSYLLGSGGHVESDRVFVGPVWRITTQTALSARVEHENRKWVDVGGATIDVGRGDKFDVVALGLDWQPWRTVGVSAQYRNEKRSSSVPIFNYRANVVGLAVKLNI
ncbi:outer membrane beta-barrel protein [Ramlibacter algicola]|uniref:Outer membrane beta-barrel protein n=1 Tax=Ramlibacter algicola TaxID=2795217 RepID=A0A934PZH9_9BURK|nr:outer membrane beta-barrel protein [Ramlibacter algicola]MBK0392248.1 outer membrane beta-barrel protein [Ramlibacter algicola]